MAPYTDQEDRDYYRYINLIIRSVNDETHWLTVDLLSKPPEFTKGQHLAAIQHWSNLKEYYRAKALAKENRDGTHNQAISGLLTQFIAETRQLEDYDIYTDEAMTMLTKLDLFV